MIGFEVLILTFVCCLEGVLYHPVIHLVLLLLTAFLLYTASLSDCVTSFLPSFLYCLPPLYSRLLPSPHSLPPHLQTITYYTFFLQRAPRNLHFLFVKYEITQHSTHHLFNHLSFLFYASKFQQWKESDDVSGT